MAENIALKVNNLDVEIGNNRRKFKVLNDVNFDVRSRETIGIVGESGCGKSMTLLAVMGLLPRVANISRGSIDLDGTDLTRLSEREIKRLRGKSMSMIFQEPMTALNPVLTVGEQIAEAMRLHWDVTKNEAWEKAIDLLDAVHIPGARARAAEYPHQFSGGMRQRVCIAIAVACNPKLILADEPTTALDVTVQAQIFEQLQELQDRIDAGIVLVTHDMGVIGQMTQRVVVMYGGMAIEHGPTREVTRHSAHPYTQKLIECLPDLGRTSRSTGTQLPEIPGIVQPLSSLGTGCPFAARCDQAMEHCINTRPPLVSIGNGHDVACWLYSEGGNV